MSAVVGHVVNRTRNAPATPAPGALLDDFARDDGDVTDRPSSCGNFWIAGSGAQSQTGDRAGYLLGGYYTQIPGLSDSGSWLYVGPGDHNIQVDVTGATVGNDKFIIRLLGDPETLSNVELQVSATDSRLVNESPLGTFTSYASAGHHYTAGATLRYYLLARPDVSAGSTRVTVDVSATDGSGRVRIFDTTVAATPTGSWIFLGAGANNCKFANLRRMATFTDSFTRADGAAGAEVVELGAMSVASNKLATTVAAAALRLPTSVQATSITADITVGAGSGTFGLYLRGSSYNDCYKLVDGSGGSALYKVKAGAIVATVATGSGNGAGTVTASFSFIGTNWSYSRGGVVVMSGSTSDATLDALLCAGLITTQTDQLVDNLAIDPYLP